MTTLTHASSGQIKQISRVGHDAIDKVIKQFGLDKEGAQRVHEHGDEFAAAIANACRTSLANLSVTNQFADEEVYDSDCGYLSGYKKPKGITEQCILLRQFFPGIPLRVDEDVESMELPQCAEGWFAIPRWERIADTYGEAIEKVLDLLSNARNGKFVNHRKGNLLGPQYLRQHGRTAQMMQKLADQQSDHDILVVPAQFGLRHRGRSVRRAREVFNASEFGLGTFAVGCMLLTHPERLVSCDDLWIDCAGDEYGPDTEGDFDGVPYFIFYDGGVGFSARGCSRAGAGCGSGSAFLYETGQ